MSDPQGPSGFWSYVHRDDERVNGRILRLHKRIQDEFSLITGQELEIFVDRDSIAWGDSWNLKINSAIQETTFFIPIVTPSYFTSEACRKELLKFATYARSLGAEELLLPLYLVNVPGLSIESADEAVRLIAETQYFDMRELRLVEEDSADYGRAVNALAVRLSEIADAYAARPTVVPAMPGDSAEGSESDDDLASDEPGLNDRLAELEEAIPLWTSIMEEFEPVADAITDALGESGDQFTDGDTFAKRVLVARSLAAKLDQPSLEFEDLATRYTSTLLSFDPGIRALITLASEQDTREGVQSAKATLDSLRGMIDSSKGIERAMVEFKEALRGPSRQFKDLRPALKRLQTAARSMVDAHTIMDEWVRLLDENPPGSAA